ncbi:hypothetical protein I3843_11G102600 [Carya illinoinensis]|nr:hypothetical protein I3843_11G102600 [Carya illinoinensis]
MEVLASIVAEAVVAIGGPLFGSVYSMIKSTVKFRSYLDVLEKKKKSLMDLRENVKTEMESAEREGKVQSIQVIEWLNEVEKLLLGVNHFQEVKLSRHSVNCRKRYRISREVEGQLKRIEWLLKSGSSHIGVVAHIPGPSIQDETTASKTLAKTVTLLSDPEVRRIGIWGMGGIGKTTLVRNLNNKLKGTSMQPFGIVIWTTVSKNLDIKKVQTQIAERLNLEARKGESIERLAGRIYQRLEIEENFLLILDDVWEKIDLDSLGIPLPEVHTGCKIMLTSRSRDVCRDMMTGEDVKVDVLNDEEGLQLFIINAGKVVSLENIRPFAEAIARECCGLPLAIITMGTAMRGKTMVKLWKHALNELQRSVPCTGGVEDRLFKPLKWSYDSLEGKNINLDFSIEISELVRYWLAEGLIDEHENSEYSVNRGIALIENLKDSCLLEDGAREGTVKMHDVVRDVAIWIASSSEDGHKSLVRSGIGLNKISAIELSNSLKRVSFMNNEITRLPDCVIECAEASTLPLQGFEALRVLNISGSRIQSLPLSLLQLGDLRALLLRDCFYLEELPPLEGLSRLQVLDLTATRIRELPRGMENLCNLRQLNLSRTHYLETIQAGIISRLSFLEILDMTLSGYHLSVKEARIPYLSSEDLSWINGLRRYQFFIGPTANSLPTRHDKRRVTISSLNLSEGGGIDRLLSNASSLVLSHCWGLNEMLEDLVITCAGCFAGLKSLTIAGSNSSLRPAGGCAAHFDLLPNLEELHLQDLTYLESISELVGYLGLRFIRLKLIEVTRCSQMKFLLSCGYFIYTLPNLEVLKVSSCDKLEELFSHRSIQTLAPDPVVPNLRTLELKNLPKLRTLWRHTETWPHVERVNVINCNLLSLMVLNRNAGTIEEIIEEM